MELPRLTDHELRDRIQKLTAKIEQNHAKGKPPIDSAIMKTVRDIYRKELRKRNYNKG